MSNKKLWFRRKRYGLGWFPITWEGWMVILVYVAIIAYFTVGTDRQKNDGNLLIGFFVPIAVATIIVLIICNIKGEKLGWQWGDKDKK